MIDDDARGAETLGVLLRGGGFEPILVTDGTRALKAFRAVSPDVVVLDLALPGASCIDVCRQIRLESRTPVIIVSAKTGTNDIVHGLESGADDYVTKPFKCEELVARMRARLRRHDQPAGPALNIGPDESPIEIDAQASSAWRSGEPLALTPLDLHLLATLARSPREVFTREALLAQVWGHRHVAGTKLVDTQVGRLRQKIERDPLHPEVVLTVPGVGYKAGPP